jgi:hypothetical protein
MPARALAGACAHYGDVVTLAGRYVLKVVAPPAGTVDREPIEKRTANLLYLSFPLCVESDDLSEGVSAAADVQVLCPDLATANRISITARLLGAHTGSGQTPVLLVCQSPSASKP